MARVPDKGKDGKSSKTTSREAGGQQQQQAAAAAASDAAVGRLLFKPENIKYNDKSVFFSRIVFSMAAGSVCGIMGFTGAMGFFAYLIATVVLSVGLAAKTKGQAPKYFKSWRRLLVDGAFSGLVTYILLWTLFYNAVYMY